MVQPSGRRESPEPQPPAPSWLPYGSYPGGHRREFGGVAKKEDMDMSEQPLVSVVIPTYNRAELLRNALESIYSQQGIDEYFRIEVIVADDASTDHTSKIVRAY